MFKKLFPAKQNFILAQEIFLFCSVYIKVTKTKLSVFFFYCLSIKCVLTKQKKLERRERKGKGEKTTKGIKKKWRKSMY